MNIKALSASLLQGDADDTLSTIYETADTLARAKRRLSLLVERFRTLYGDERPIMLLSVPGRSELSGNHTDHNHGCVIAASIDLDTIAAVAPRSDHLIRIDSEGFAPFTVDMETYREPDPARFGTSAALVAGMYTGFAADGLSVGGFDACISSEVMGGSGLSSSAAFEVLIGTALNHLYNAGTVGAVRIAELAREAENRFFGKPCGLMDQVACAHGGIVAIDFADPALPHITPVPFDLTAAGYCLCIVNTGGNHADLTEDYASVPTEMKAVARALGVTVLRETDEESVIAAIPSLRKTVGDRAILRALHFFAENRRVLAQVDALRSNRLDEFLSGVRASGHSSFEYLQNLYTVKNVSEQGLSLALCLAEHALAGKRAACRVHGGGFAGTIQAFVPTADVASFAACMDNTFGKGACKVLHVRSVGAVRLQ